MKLSAVVEDRQAAFAVRAAAKIRRRLTACAARPPALRPPRKVAISLPAAEWEALLKRAGL